MNTRRTGLTFGLLVVATAGAATLAGAAAPAKNGRIAFVRVELGSGGRSSEIFVANADGSGEQQVTQPPKGFRDDLPDWSPDGARIVFQRCDATWQHCRVWSTIPDGTGQKLLSTSCPTARARPACARDGAPVFSPSGRQIVFTRAKAGDFLMVADAELKHARVLALPLGRATAYVVAWSPNGKQLAVAVMRNDLGSFSTGENSHALYVVNANGTGARRLTPWSLDAGGRPDWSPDGTQILFRSNALGQGGFGANLYIVRPDGSGLRKLTRMKRSDRVLDGVFSPDGTSIAFPTSAGATTGAVGHRPDIFVMRLDSTGLTPVTRSANWDAEPDWGRT